MIEPRRDQVLAKAKPEAQHPMLAAFRDLAHETGAWLLLGSIVVRDDGAERLANRSFLITPRARSPRATTRSTCSTSICRPARATANRALSPGRDGAGRPRCLGKLGMNGVLRTFALRYL